MTDDEKARDQDIFTKTDLLLIKTAQSSDQTQPKNQIDSKYQSQQSQIMSGLWWGQGHGWSVTFVIRNCYILIKNHRTKNIWIQHL